MDLQAFIDSEMKRVRASKLLETNQMTLGGLIEKLKQIPMRSGEDEQTVQFDFEYLIPTTLDSWRGSYNELALGWTYGGYAPDGCPDHNSLHNKKLSEFITELEDAIGKEFQGWKGGEYVMDESTPIWVSNPGNSGNTTISEVVDNGYNVILMTSYCEY